jgi:hypothetical protein
MKNRYCITASIILFWSVSLHASYDCQYCSEAGPLRDVIGYPTCQIVFYSAASPHCEAISDDATPYQASQLPKDCVWVENDSMEISWALWQGTPTSDETGHNCEDYQLVTQGSFLVPACSNTGNCLIITRNEAQDSGQLAS